MGVYIKGAKLPKNCEEGTMKDIISVVTGELQTEFDGAVMKAVQNCGIHVDKEELIKALELAETLVRCKDCKWKKPNNEGDYDCKCHIPTFRVPKDGYCNFGERIEECL